MATLSTIERLQPRSMSVRWKVFLPVAAIVLAAFLGYAYIGLQTAETGLLGRANRSADVLAAMIERVLRPSVVHDDTRTLGHLVDDLSDMPELEALRVLRPDGRIWVGRDRGRAAVDVEVTRRETAPLRRAAADSPDGSAGQMTARRYRIVRIIRTSDRLRAPSPAGYLEMDLSMEDTRERIRTGRVGLMIVMAVTLVVLGAALILILNLLVSAPLRELTDAMSQVESGDLKARAQIESGDELERLGHSFNRMVEEIDSKNEQLLRSEKLASIGLLAAGVAHEINNPVATISMSAEGLYETEPLPDRRRFLRAIIMESERIGAIVGNLLGFERGGHSAYEPCSLSEIVHEAQEDLAREAERAGVTVTVSLDLPRDTILGQAEQLRQAFVHIMDNALRAMDSGGRLDVTADAPGSVAFVHIRDTGPGIPEEHQARIFDPFFTTREVGEGFGLGLAVCYEIIKRHGGDIRVQSGDGGTTFTLELPLHEAATEEARGETRSSSAPGR